MKFGILLFGSQEFKLFWSYTQIMEAKEVKVP